MATTAPKPFCFVLMPFDSAFGDVYELGIRAACETEGAYCERVDEQIYDGRILDRIYNQIAKADFVVADMTGRNANVFYEVGYAHALGKRTVLLTKRADDIPFDLKHFPHIVYGDSVRDLRDQLAKRIHWFVQNPEQPIENANAGLRLFMGAVELTETEVDIPIDDSDGALRVTVENRTPRIVDPNSFKIGVIGRGIEHITQNRPKLITFLPDERVQVLLTTDTAILPGECRGLNWWVARWQGESLPVVVRLYSEREPKDFPIRVFWPLPGN